MLGPLAAGVTVRRLMPAAAARLARPVSLLGTGLLVVSVLPVLFIAWPAIVSLIGNGTILAIAAFVLIGLAIG
jgi:BASS family bile acid:Na+ symporter